MTRLSQDELCEKINKELREQTFSQGGEHTPDEQAGEERIEEQKESTREHMVKVFTKACDPEYSVVNFFKKLFKRG